MRVPLVIVCRLLALLLPSCVAANGSLLPLQKRADGPSRTVSVIIDTFLRFTNRDPTTGKTIFMVHSALQFAGTDLDGPMRVEIISKNLLNPSGQVEGQQLALRALDLTTENTGKPIGKEGPEDTTRYVEELGQATLRNSDIASPLTGKGLLVDTWGQDPVYRSRVPNVNNCNNLIQKLVSALGLQTGEPATTYLEQSELYSQLFGNPVNEEITNFYYEEAEPESGSWGENWRLGYNIEDPSEPELVSNNMIRRQPNPVQPAEAAEVESGEVGDLPTIAEESRPPPNPFSNQPNEEAFTDLCPRNFGPVLARRCASEVQSTTSVALGRTGGILSTISLVAEDTAKAAGVLGALAAPVFVILDLVDGNWIGGGFAAAGLALGVAATLAVGGPIGWLVGGLVAALFSILPGLFSGAQQAALITNTTQIVQWSVFGDKDHTGNEQCQQQGNSNCTAVYGAGVLSSVFKWNNFDSIAFLLQYNQGYPMTIPEIAGAFQVVDPLVPNNASNSSNSIATINCNNQPRIETRFGSIGDNPDLCNHPTYAINRAMIVIPVINETADIVFNRIIPNPGGDCQLLVDTGESQYPEYNLSITGQPAAIACNITAALNISGVAVSLNDSSSTNGQTPALVSPGNASTDGENGHYIAPPPAVPFQQPFNASNALCMGDSNGDELCLPNGTYSIQTGALGFNTGDANSLTLSAGAWLSFSILEISGRGPEHTQNYNVSSNITSSDGSGLNGLRQLATGGGASFTASVPTPAPPAVCLFTSTNYQGDVICFGPGGDNLTADAQNVAQSLKVFGAVTVWMYAQHYGDDGGVPVTASVPDLTAETYGNQGTFNKDIKALWVHT